MKLKGRLHKFFSWSAMSLAVSLVSVTATHAQSYAVSGLTTTPVTSSGAHVNIHNQVVGIYNGDSAFQWDPSAGITLPFSGHAISSNDSGEIIGISGSPVLYSEGSVHKIPGTSGSAGVQNIYAINNPGQVVGTEFVPLTGEQGDTYNFYDALLWTPKKANGATGASIRYGLASYHDNPAGDYSITEGFLSGINDLGEITGVYLKESYNATANNQTTTQTGFIGTSSNKSITYIPAESGDQSSSPTAINSNGAVVGESDQQQQLSDGLGDGETITTNVARHAFVWIPSTPSGKTGTVTDLGNLGTPSGDNPTYASAVNDSNVVVGTSNGSAFVWDAVNGIRDLNTLIPVGSGWQLNTATSINNLGYITGDGFYNGTETAYLLYTPTTSLTGANVKGDFGSVIKLKADLMSVGANTPLNDEVVTFTVDGTKVGTATTVNGIATLSYKLNDNIKVGNHTVGIVFSGDTYNAGSTGSFTLNAERTHTSFIFDPRSGARGGSVTLTAQLDRTTDKHGISKKSVTFTVGTTVIGTSKTNSSGIASIVYAIPTNAKRGRAAISVSFTGTTQYDPSNASSTLTIK